MSKSISSKYYKPIFIKVLPVRPTTAFVSICNSNNKYLLLTLLLVLQHELHINDEITIRYREDLILFYSIYQHYKLVFELYPLYEQKSWTTYELHLQELLRHGNPYTKLPAHSVCADVNARGGLELCIY